MTYIKQAIVIIVIFIFFMPLEANCSEKTSSGLKAAEGVLDLTQWNKDDGIIKMDGQWEFYWYQLLTPERSKEVDAEKKEYIDLPGAWNGYKANEETLPGEGFATYRLFLKTAEKERLAIKMPRIFTSYNLWINEELMAVAGTVGESRELSTPQYLPQIVFFETDEGTNEIVIQVSNYHHRSGGILESLTLGTEKQILRIRYSRIAYELFLFGSLTILGIYHIALFFFRRKEYAPFYLGLLSIFLGIRTLLVGERFLIYLFPYFNWEIAHKIQTLTFYLGSVVIIMFFKSIFTNDISNKIIRTVQIVGFAFGGLVFLTPARIFTVANPVFQLFGIFLIIYIVCIFVIKLYKREKDIGLIIAGALALIITSLNDIIFFSVWMNDNSDSILRNIFITGNLSSLGQLIFVFAHSLLLARKFSNAFEEKEIVTAKLTELNLNLDKLVKKRTEALENSKKKVEHQKSELEKANAKLHLISFEDPLTGLWNRRKFDKTIQLEWRRSLRNRRPISLLFIDIDNFKAYNDYYGHKEGDECLVKVSQALKNSFKRASDVVARYGGEEFVVLMAEIEENEAVQWAQALKEEVEALHIPHKCSPVSIFVTVSIGVASIIPDYNHSPEDLLELADKALYKAKTAGKNKIEFI